MSVREEAYKIVSTAGLLLIDAMVFHEVIASFHKNIPTISSLMASQNLKRELEDSWRNIIQNINYEPVLEIALNILMNMPASPSLDRELRELAKLSYDIASSRVLLRHDLFGRIYHNLLLGNLAKYYATYYTSIPAARLLARLLINLPSSLNVSTVPPTYNGEPLKVVDFACGSGTLLSAIYKEVDAKHRIESRELRVNELHKYLIEEGIWGFDVLHHAVHLAAMALFLHNPIPVSGSRLFALRLGKMGKNVYLGSINFLSSPILAQDMILTGEAMRGQEVIGVSRREVKSIELPSFHICIMNPPFTRSVGGNLLFGSLPKEERVELQRELSKLLKEKNIAGIGQAGLGAVFVFLADKYLEEGGRMGLVLPRAVLTGVSWQKVRELLMDKYHIEYIVTSYEMKNQWNFSENTDLSEILLVARKRRNLEEPGYTFFVNLWKKPSNELESIHIGSQLTQLYKSGSLHDIENSNASPYHLKLHGKKIGEVYSARLAENNFGIYNFFSQMELNRTLLLLRKGIVYLPDQGIVGNIKLTTLSKLGAEIGPDVRQVHAAFRHSQVGSIYKAFWGYDSSIINSIYQEPNSYLEPKNAGQARNLWMKRGKLLIVERAWLSTYTVLAVYLDEEVLSNVWWPIKINEEFAKILAVWMNSTFGFLLLSSIAEVTRGPWVKFKKDYLWGMFILDINSLSKDAIRDLLNLYERVKHAKFKSLPQEFAQPSTRRIIDEEICKILGLDIKLSALHEMLAKEPMLIG